MKVLGLMSGTSLDGVDLALCEFHSDGRNYTFDLLASETVAYPDSWMKKLERALTLTAEEYVRLDYELGRYFGYLCNDFILKHQLSPDCIASHGHTVFHQPDAGFTGQIGHGSQIYAITSLPVISDFRSVDVGLKGQGAPLVPIGDQYLFNDFGYLLNLGGIANITMLQEKGLLALDITPFNQVLNYLSMKLGFPYDEGGQLAKKGTLDLSVLEQLKSLAFFSKEGNKSLGKEWVDQNYLPIVDEIENVEDALHTVCVHVAIEISKIIKAKKARNNKVLCTGGGAYNSFVMDLLRDQLEGFELVIESEEITEFKEAIVFAFLGYLRKSEKINVLCQATGAEKDAIGGALYG